MVHCSGGAQTKVLHFVDNLHIIKDDLFPVPPPFELIQQESNTDWQEMYKVFNMGHRMEWYIPQEIAAEVISISESFGIPAPIVGRAAASDETKETVHSPFGPCSYEYSKTWRHNGS